LHNATIRSPASAARYLFSNHPIPFEHAIPHRRFFTQFASESAFHSTADQTLDDIQDSIEQALEAISADYELSYASGVLTLVIPKGGTWVINKQTPTKQLWWSSPKSGPKRFEYNFDQEQWVGTKDDAEEIIALLEQEVKQIYPKVETFSR
jgi:frataxin